MEFKGTKEKWEVRGNKVFVKGTYKCIATISVCNNFDINSYEKIEDEEMKYNILLISKAPLMLEKLKYIHESMSCGYDKDELNALIREVTEL